MNKTNNSFEAIEDFFGKKPVVLAQELHYSEENLLILEMNKKEIMRKYNQTFQNILSNFYAKDTRNEMEYARDIVVNWLLEDYCLQLFKEWGYKTTLSGADKGRKILSCKATSNECDFKLKKNRKKCNIELQVNYTGFWIREGLADLRDSKYRSIIEHESSILFISIPEKKFILTRLDSLHSEYCKLHHAYKKPVYRVSVQKDMWKNFNKENFDYSFSNVKVA